MTCDSTDEERPHPLIYAAVKTAADFMTFLMIALFVWFVGWLLLHIYSGGGVPL